MHVDIHITAGHMQSDHERRAHARGERGAIRRLSGAHDAVIAYHATINHEQHASRRGPDISWPFDHTGDMDGPLDVVHVYKSLDVLMSPELG